jgi:hypothetical protein
MSQKNSGSRLADVIYQSSYCRGLTGGFLMPYPTVRRRDQIRNLSFIESPRQRLSSRHRLAIHQNGLIANAALHRG